MKRTMIIVAAVLVLGLIFASPALAKPRADKATGTFTIETGYTYEFVVFEEVGTPGEPGYRPEKGYLMPLVYPSNPMLEGMMMPVWDVNIMSDTAFTFECSLGTAMWFDYGEPAAWVDMTGGWYVTDGNIQVHNYADDGD